MIRQTLRFQPFNLSTFQPFNLSTMDFPSWVEMMRRDTALSTFQPFNLSTIGNCDTAPQEELESVRRCGLETGVVGGCARLLLGAPRSGERPN